LTQATKERQRFVAFIGSLQTINAEQEAYEEIRELHEKMVRLLHEDQAQAATTGLR
jgi:hypothetical protein